MRNLFLALVLANLGFAAWHLWYSAPPQASHAAPNVPRILLASELAAQEGELPPELLAELPPADADAVSDDANVPVSADANVAEAADPNVAAADGIGGAADANLAAAADSGAPGDTPADATGAAAVAGGDVGVALRGAADAETGVSPAETRGAATEQARTGGAQTSGSCTSVGPFRELAQAATAAAGLHAHGLEPVQRAGEGDVWVGYWVYIAAIPTVAEAQRIRGVLVENGMSDSYVIPNSDTGSLVSLGVFSDIARADRRTSDVRKLGYEATVAERTRRATVYWIDVPLASGQTLDLTALEPPGRIARLERRACDNTSG